MYADVIVDISHEKLDRIFQYHIPDHLAAGIRPGAAVLVPFGRGNRPTRGFVTGVQDMCAYPPEKIKELTALATDVSASDSLIRLAIWMKERYGGTLAASLRTVLVFEDKKSRRPHRVICLHVSPAELDRAIREMPGTMKARKRLLTTLQKTPRLDYTFAMESLRLSKSTVDTLVGQKLIRVEETTVYRRPAMPVYSHTGVDGLPPLQPGQQEVLAAYRQKRTEKESVFLLQGVTGSGKTRVYIEMIREVLREKKQAIVLIPEIALTLQTLQRFYSCFGERVSVLHSRMSAGERYDQMMMAKEGKLDIMIGPRSALFTPFPSLGLIVIDEEHETSYKSEQTPRYHAVDTAIYRAHLEGCSVVLGSATPSVSSMYMARREIYSLLRLPDRIGGRQMSKVEIVDMRKELASGNRQLLSRPLVAAIADRLSRNEQSILFLNRRGYAGFLSCRACGEVIKCPNCDISLSLHNGGRLVCHYCGYERERIRACPSCGSEYIGEFKAGTQQVEELVRKIYPKSRILRMDKDTTSGKGSHEKILEAFSEKKADILIGTQMIVKGHDFQNVTLVGILLADLSLHSGDYMAAERTFDLLTQAAGRAGRGEKEGLTLIQTYAPEHYAVTSAARQNYDAFYEKEIRYRRMMGYPPVGAMLAVLLSAEDEGRLGEAARYFSLYAVGVADPGVQVLGPVNAAIYKMNGIYRKMVYFKGAEYDMLVRQKDLLEKYVEINSGFAGIRILFDFNPVDRM